MAWPTDSLVTSSAHCRYHGGKLPDAANPAIYQSALARAQFEAGKGGPLGIAYVGTAGVFAPPIDALHVSTALPPIHQLPSALQTLRLHLAGCALTPEGEHSTVELRSADPFMSPRVATNMLATASERRRASLCLTRLRDITKGFPRKWSWREWYPAMLGFNQMLAPVEKQAARAVVNAYHFVRPILLICKLPAEDLRCSLAPASPPVLQQLNDDIL